MAEPAPAPATGRSHLALISLLTALVGVGPLSVSFYIPSLPAIGMALEASPAAVQATITWYLVGFAGMQLFLGPLSDMVGRMPVLFGGLSVYALASLACAMATSIEFLWVARLVQGAAACTGPVLGRAIVRDLFDGPEIARAFAFIGTAIALAPAIGPIVGGLVQVWLGWEANFLVLALFAVVLIALARSRLSESNHTRIPDALRPGRLLRIYRDLLVNRRYVGNIAPGIGAFAGLLTFTASAPYLFVRELGLSPDTFGLLTLFHVTGYAAGAFVSGRLAGRIAPQRVIASGLFLSGLAGVLMLAFADSLSVVRLIGPFTLYTFGFGLLLPSSMAAALQPFPRVAGSASALMGFMQFAAGASTSLLAAMAYDATAWPLGLFLCATSFGGAAVYLATRPWR